MTIVFLGEGAAQNGRMAETLNAASKAKLPLLFLVIDNGRAINTFTPDVAANSDVFLQVMRGSIWDCDYLSFFLSVQRGYRIAAVAAIILQSMCLYKEP